MDERRLSLKEVVQQGWDQVRDQFLEQLRGTMEGLLEAERDRRVTQSDMDWFEQAMSITDSKTEAGVRRVPLNTDAMLGFRILKERASKLGIDGPNSYVFPACEHWHFDPTRPQKSWRSAWRALT